MAKKTHLILSEVALRESGWLVGNIEEAREFAKRKAEEYPENKYFILDSSEYAVCNITPCTFFSPDYLVDVNEEEDAPREREYYRGALNTPTPPRRITRGTIVPGDPWDVTMDRRNEPQGATHTGAGNRTITFEGNAFEGNAIEPGRVFAMQTNGIATDRTTVTNNETLDGVEIPF